MSSKTTTFIVTTRDGEGFDTRASDSRLYSHAVIVKGTKPGATEGAVSWHSTLGNAMKQRDAWIKSGHYPEARVEPVTSREGTKATIVKQLRAERAEDQSAADAVSSVKAVIVDGVKVAETKHVDAKPAKVKAAEKLVNEPTATKATKAKAAKIIAEHEGTKPDLAAQRSAALEKAREARVANMSKPAPVENGVTWGLSGKHHGLVEGSTFDYCGKDRKAGPAKAQRLTMTIVDRVFITGVDSKGTEQMRVHIAGSFWAKNVKAPKATKPASK
jgi:hypothetical protein